jgi:penicillin amidase
MRFIADLNDWDNTRQNIPLGQSGIPSSAHWKDQLGDWQAVSPPTFAFSKKAIAGAAKETVVMIPGGAN